VRYNRKIVPGARVKKDSHDPGVSRVLIPAGSAAVACLAAFIGILFLYGPALKGHFVFDDLSLPFCQISVRDAPLANWISRQRPVLMFSYWLNYRLWGASPLSYHLVNVVIHCTNAGLVFLVLRRIVTMAGWPPQRAARASLLGAVVFAIHPLQTESVSYVAGRSESLASLFLLLAYVVFLYRRNESISWLESLLILVLFAAGVKTKENAVSLAGILILTDLAWPTPFSLQGLRRNWRLYCLMIPGVAAAAVAVFRMLAGTTSAGFSVASFKWYQYGFTEARAIFTYIRLAVFPLGQSLDQDYATSHTITEHGAIYCIILLAALIAVSVAWRRRYPLFCFGLLMFLIWLAPTSSIVPVDDALVERRMYLPLLGLILIGFEAASRLRLSRATAGCLLALAGIGLVKLCYDRNQLWSEPDRLLELAAAKAAYNPRPLLNFTELLIRHNRCDLAPAYLQRAERRLPDNYYVNASWGRTLACLGRYDQALQRLQAAARIQPCSQVFEWMGLVYGQMGLQDQAGQALKKAVELGPKSETAHGSLALWYEKRNNLSAAEEEYRRAIALDQLDSWAQTSLSRVQAKEAASDPAF
jgi:tetratricopeptide (TPR) repeat protein